MSATLVWGFAKRFWREGVLTLAAIALVWTFVNYRDAQREIGKREVRLAALDSSLRVVAADRARVDTVRVRAVETFTRTVTAWQHDTVRVAVMAAPDSTSIPAPVVHALLAQDSVVIANGVTALAVSDTARAIAERAATLWKGKADAVAPSRLIIRYEPSRAHRVRDWAEHLTVGALVYVAVREHTQRHTP